MFHFVWFLQWNDFGPESNLYNYKLTWGPKLGHGPYVCVARILRGGRGETKGFTKSSRNFHPGAADFQKSCPRPFVVPHSFCPRARCSEDTPSTNVSARLPLPTFRMETSWPPPRPTSGLRTRLPQMLPRGFRPQRSVWNLAGLHQGLSLGEVLSTDHLTVWPLSNQIDNSIQT